MNETTAVVTGGTRGLGRAVADGFADAGARVVICGRDADAVEETVEAVSGEATGLRADVRDEFDLERLMETAARFGPGGIDVVVPAAAVRHGAAGKTLLSGVSYAAFDDMFRTNARGVFGAVNEALPHMPDDGRVLVPTCEVAREPGSGAGGYAVSKAAAEAVVRGFAADCEQVVGAVDPGPLATELSGGDGRDPEEVAELFVWAVEEASADEVDRGVVSVEDWEAATE